MITKHYYPNKHRPRWMLKKVTDPMEITLIHLGELYCNPGCGHNAANPVYGKFTCTYYFDIPWAKHEHLVGFWKYKRYKRAKVNDT